MLTISKVAPALAAGNTVVVKTPSLTPLSVSLMLECFLETEFKNGEVNCIHGSGNEIGKWLITSPELNKISFTGSTEVGRKIMTLAGENLKKVTLELGGNSPALIFADADLDKAAKEVAYRSFRNMGQVCNSINRIYVHEKVFDAFIDNLKSVTENYTIDNGLTNPTADLGPMASKERVSLVEEHIKDAVDGGAKIISGGHKPSGFNKGHFFEPTLLANTDHKMRIMREETFGPVAPVMSFKDREEGLSLANDSDLGLVGYIYTRDLNTAVYASEKLQCGTVSVNNVTGAQIGYPYSGWKQSGIGIEMSEDALYEYLNIKHIRIKI
jgi:acyl-CoA reductase-like NAD-dependent aldehyde dehydrogenase